MTPFYLRQQIKNVEDLVDFVIVEMHAGSEYSHAPGSDYDSTSRLTDFRNMKKNNFKSFIQYLPGVLILIYVFFLAFTQFIK